MDTTRISRASFAAASFAAVLAASHPAAATQLTPGASVEIEAELSAKPLAFRYYRSYGTIPGPRGNRPNGLRYPSAADYVAPMPPADTVSAAPGQTSSFPRLEPRWPRIDPGTIACITRYPSFDALTGSYAADDGRVRRCPFLP